MIQKKYSEIDPSKESYRLCKELTRKVMPVLEEKYSFKGEETTRFDVESTIEAQLSKIISVLGANLTGKVIVDIGCGSEMSLDSIHFSDRHEEPWLCRALYHLGHSPTGIDIGRSDEEFNYLRKDLTRYRLEDIDDGSVDLINVSLLYTSPFFRKSGGNENVRDELEKVFERKLKPGGFYIFEE